MTCGRIILTVCLTFVAFTSGRIVENNCTTLFPYGKSLVYDYCGEVKVELTESGKSASHYFINGDFYITHYLGNKNLKNAFVVTLQNATSSSKNGNAFSERTPVPTSSSKALKVLEGPFGVIFSESGQLESVTISEKEPVWSRNIKFSWASMLQLNFKNINFKSPAKAQSFVIPESTIYGQCKTSYGVNKRHSASNETEALSVTKFTSPLDCAKYKPFSFDFVDVRLCALPEEETLNQASSNTYEIEVENGVLYLRKLYTRGEINYYPFHDDPEAYFALYNATFTLKSITPASEYVGPTVDFAQTPSTRDWSYQRTNGFYAPGAAVDITNGRHLVDQTVLTNEVIQMLDDAAIYLGEHRNTLEEPDWQRSKLINSIQETLTYLEISSFERIFFKIQNTSSSIQKVKRSLFLGIVSQVGTTAANMFAFQIIKSNDVTDLEAVEILAKLPFHVRIPSEDLLAQWESFSKCSESLSSQVHKSAILATGTMVYRTYPYMFGFNPTVQRHLEHAYQQVLNESTYEMKVVWLGVIHNIQVGDIAKLLSPILTGEVAVSERPDYIRLLSIGAMLRSLYFDYDRAIDLLWPLMTDSSLPLKLRIGSYNILLQQSRTMADFLRIHSFLVHEKNEHLHNFHVTTLQGFAKTHCPCFAKMHEYSSKVIKLTPTHSPSTKNLTALYVIDTMNDVGDGLQFKITVVRDEDTEVPEIVYLQQFLMENHKITSNWGLYLQSDGMDDLLKSHNNDFMKFFEGPITERFFFEFIRKLSTTMTLSRNSFVDALLFYRDQAVMINFYNHRSFSNLNNHVKEIIEHYNYLDSYHVFYQNIFEEHAVSDFGTPVVFGARSPAVLGWEVKTNHLEIEDFSARVVAKVWLFHEYFISSYNPIADVWHSAQQLSVANTQVSYRFEINNHHKHKILEYIDSRDWNIQFVEANINIQNREVASITGNSNNDTLRTNGQAYHREVIVPSETSGLRNLSPVNFTNSGKQYEITLFNCENPPRNATNEEYTRALPRFENHNLILFPMSLQTKNCVNVIKIRPSSK